jgi:outer membrane lipoprotein SlyB
MRPNVFAAPEDSIYIDRSAAESPAASRGVADMRNHIAIALLSAAALAVGCADTGSTGRASYGESSGTVATSADRNGRINTVEIIKVDENYQFGVGTVVGAVAGGLLGSQIGHGSGRVVGGVVGAGVGAAAGTYAESKMKTKDAQRVVVSMSTGGQVTVVQPVDGRLRNGMNVRVQGSGESARVVPQ